MQRLVCFFLIAGFFFSTVSAQDYFERLRSARESIDSLIEYTRNVEANSVEEHVLRELQGTENRLGAAQSELYILGLRGWLLDLGRQYEMLEDEVFIIFEQNFMQAIEHLFTGETTNLELNSWVREQTATLFGGRILESQYTQFTVTLNALNQNAIATHPQTGRRFVPFFEDIQAFFESYYLRGAGLERDCVFLIQAVARSLFNLSVELAFSVTQSSSVSHVYSLLMEVIRGLYALLGRVLPGVGTIRLSPRTLVGLPQNENDTELTEAQQRTPRSGALSPREIFGLLNEGENIDAGIPGVTVFHQRAASTGHSVLTFQKYVQ